MWDPWLLVIRTVFAFCILYSLTRILGRKEVSQLTFADFISGITFGSLAGNIIFNPTVTLLDGLIVLGIWTSLVLISSFISIRSLPARKLLEGQPILAIYQGHILEENLKKAHYTTNDLLMLLREKGIFDPGQLEAALIEYDGKISTLSQNQCEPKTSYLFKKKLSSIPDGIVCTKELILDGNIIHENLQGLGVDEIWLRQQLASKGITETRDISAAFITPNGNIYIDTYHDNITSDK